MGNKDITSGNGYEDEPKGSVRDSRVEDELIAIGYITGPHGIRGEVRVKPANANLDEFILYEKVYVTTESGRVQIYTPENVRHHKSRLIMSIKEIKTRTLAYELKNSTIQVKASELPPLEEDTYYEYQLLGSEVYNTEGTYLGILDDILYTGGTDVFVIDLEDGDEKLIPAVKENICEIKVEDKGRITIKDLEWY